MRDLKNGTVRTRHVVGLRTGGKKPRVRPFPRAFTNAR